jgi:hypothetical protein
MDSDVFLSGPRFARTAYTATIKHTFERTFADGNTIHWTSESTQARDESGRNLQVRIEGCDISPNGQPQLRTMVTVSDPVAKTFTHWNTGPGTSALATITHQHISTQPSWKDIPREPSVPYRPETTREDLGTRTIAGMQATGSRVTEIIPAGREGNDSPMKIVHESWMDKQSHMMLMITQDDPRTGHSTWEVQGFTVGAPDPALFTPPPNYKIWDQEAQQQSQTSADSRP